MFEDLQDLYNTIKMKFKEHLIEIEENTSNCKISFSEIFRNNKQMKVEMKIGKKKLNPTVVENLEDAYRLLLNENSAKIDSLENENKVLRIDIK